MAGEADKAGEQRVLKGHMPKELCSIVSAIQPQVQVIPTGNLFGANRAMATK